MMKTFISSGDYFEEHISNQVLPPYAISHMWAKPSKDYRFRLMRINKVYWSSNMKNTWNLLLQKSAASLWSNEVLAQVASAVNVKRRSNVVLRELRTELTAFRSVNHILLENAAVVSGTAYPPEKVDEARRLIKFIRSGLQTRNNFNVIEFQRVPYRSLSFKVFNDLPARTVWFTYHLVIV